MNAGARDLFDLSGKVALVTGGAQGMGYMIAQGLLDAGATVYLTSRKADLARSAARELSARGACIGVQADLSSAEAATVLARWMAEREPRLHILVNNAGKTWGAKLADFPDHAWDSVMRVNVQAPFTLARDLLPQLSAAGAGADPARVINIGSLAGHRVERIGAYSYVASKAAIHHLSRELAAELAPLNITVNAVAPGYFPTRMTSHIRADERESEALIGRVPLARLGRPEDIAGLCIFLSSAAGAYLTGTVIPLDGGISGCL